MTVISLMLTFYPLYSYVLLLVISRVLQLGLYLFLHRSLSLCLSVYFPQVRRGICSICMLMTLFSSTKYGLIASDYCFSFQ